MKIIKNDLMYRYYLLKKSLEKLNNILDKLMLWAKS